MINPWLEMPEADYVGHMSSEDVGQLPVLAEIFQDALRPFAPADVLVLGRSNGNGFEHIDPAVTRRVTGIDINPTYLQALASRFPAPAYQLSLECADLDCYRFPLEKFDLIHAPLIFEYVDWERLLPRLIRSLRLHGLLTAVVQQPSPSAPAVSLTHYPSLRTLERLFRFVRPESLRRLAVAEGLRIDREFELRLKQEKAFHVFYLRRPETARGNSASGAAGVAETM